MGTFNRQLVVAGLAVLGVVIAAMPSFACGPYCTPYYGSYGYNSYYGYGFGNAGFQSAPLQTPAVVPTTPLVAPGVGNLPPNGPIGGAPVNPNIQPLANGAPPAAGLAPNGPLPNGQPAPVGPAGIPQ